MTPQAGDIGLVVSLSLPGTLIRLGDAIKAARIGVSPEPYSHVVVCVGGGKLVEACPSGARMRDVSEYAKHEVRWVCWPGMTYPERGKVALKARALADKRVPYNWVDIAALTLTDLGWPIITDHRVTRVGRRAASETSLVCSALAVVCYRAALIPLLLPFVPGAITPGDLARTRELVTA